MNELTPEDTNYLAVRGFQRVTSAPPGMPYLFLGQESNTLGSSSLRFNHKFHSGGYESGLHPSNSTLEEAIDFIEHAIVAGRDQSVFFIPPDKKIYVQVIDPNWDPVVEFLFRKYN